MNEKFFFTHFLLKSDTLLNIDRFIALISYPEVSALRLIFEIISFQL